MEKMNEKVLPLKKPSFRHELKELFREWLLRTTSHGIPNIVRAPNLFIRLIWLVFFISSVSYCSVVIIRSFIQFFQYQITISISEIRESPTNYPAVTFCNLNPFNEQYSFNYMTSKSYLFPEIDCIGGDISNVSAWGNCFSTDNPDDILNGIIYKLKRSIANDNLTSDELFYFGFDLYYDMLISCKFNNQPCYADNFTKFWSNEYGFCYTFNDGTLFPVLQTSEGGPAYGLKMELAVQPPTNTIFAYRNGIILFVHNQSTTPLELSNGILISAGAETYIGVKRTFKTKQPYPFSNCISDLTPFSNYSKKLFGYFSDLNVTSYDAELCVNLCYQDKLIDLCGCCDLVTNSIRNANYCQSDAEITCIDNLDTIFASRSTDSLCENTCRQPCNNQVFEISISEAAYPSTSYLNLLSTLPSTSVKFPTGATTEQLITFSQQSILKFIVNYNELAYTGIDENPALTLDALLGNIGGQLGLFIGISILSLIELLEFVSEFLILAYKMKISNKNQQANVIQVVPFNDKIQI